MEFIFLPDQFSIELIQPAFASYHLKPNDLLKNMAKPSVAVFFHFLYFLARIRKNIAAYAKIVWHIIRNPVQKAFVASPQNYKQVDIAGWAVCVVSVRAKIPHTFHFRVRPFDVLDIVFQ